MATGNYQLILKIVQRLHFAQGLVWASLNFAGLCGVPSSFQQLMNSVLRGLPFVAMYLDDILIHSANEELHKCTRFTSHAKGTHTLRSQTDYYRMKNINYNEYICHT